MKDSRDFSTLYPFLGAERSGAAGGPDAAAGGGSDTASDEDAYADVRNQVRASSRAKILDVVDLRRRVARDHGERLTACAGDVARRLSAGGRLFTFGNGGSSTDAQDMARLFVWPGPTRRPLPAIALTNDIAAVTALTNDIGFDAAFARQLGAFGRAGDVAVGLSTSGNSENLLAAFDQAKRLGMLTVGLAGGDGGKMADLGSIDHLFVMPSASVHRIQEAQTTVYHVLWELTVAAIAEAGAAQAFDAAAAPFATAASAFAHAPLSTGASIFAPAPPLRADADAVSPASRPSGSGLPAQPSPAPSGVPGGDKT